MSREYVTVIINLFVIIKIRLIGTLTICFLFVFSINTIAYAEGDQEQVPDRQRHEWSRPSLIGCSLELDHEKLLGERESPGASVPGDYGPQSGPLEGYIRRNK